MVEFRRPTGTQDFLPREMAVRNYVDSVIRRTFEEYGFQQIKTPTFEEFALLSARSGEEIRRKMYTFVANGAEYALRPELTVPICRLVASGDLEQMPKPYRLYYVGQCFRYESPGKDREFRQAGLELMGSSSPIADAEVITIAVRVLEKLGISDYKLELSNTGIFRGILREAQVDLDYWSEIIGDVDHITNLREECQFLQTKSAFDENDIEYVRGEIESLYRLQGEIEYSGEHKSPLIQKLDEDAMNEWLLKLPVTAEETYKMVWIKQNGISEEYSNLIIEISRICGTEEAIIENAENLLKGTSAENAFQNLLEVCRWLDIYGVKTYEVALGVTRGFDFYTGTVFKIDDPILGSQKYIGGGGRYDDLVGGFGGAEIPATGFAFGFERVVEAFEKSGAAFVQPKKDYYLATTSEDLSSQAVKVAETLRKKGNKVEIDLMGRNLTTQLDYAAKANFAYAVIMDSEGLKSEFVTVMDMKTREKQQIKISTLGAQC
ncbi:MAG: histidine--tRNA ligase [Candidatus Poribacteria bacterium]